MNHSNLSVQPSSASNIAGPRRLENVIDWPKVGYCCRIVLVRIEAKARATAVVRSIRWSLATALG